MDTSQNLDVRARPLHRQSNPPDAGTEHLGATHSVGYVQRRNLKLITKKSAYDVELLNNEIWILPPNCLNIIDNLMAVRRKMGCPNPSLVKR